MARLQQLAVPCIGTAHLPAQDDSTAHMKHSTCEHCSNPTTEVLRLPRRFGRALIWLYRHTLSPLVGYNCRHLPTCSVYGDEAIERFGLWAGGWMTLARLLRCNPFGTSGIDNVPLTAPQGARWYLPWRYARWRGVNAA
jgi:putative membrane protein insertion efficiency factor